MPTPKGRNRKARRAAAVVVGQKPSENPAAAEAGSKTAGTAGAPGHEKQRRLEQRQEQLKKEEAEAAAAAVVTDSPGKKGLISEGQDGGKEGTNGARRADGESATACLCPQGRGSTAAASCNHHTAAFSGATTPHERSSLLWDMCPTVFCMVSLSYLSLCVCFDCCGIFTQRNATGILLHQIIQVYMPFGTCTAVRIAAATAVCSWLMECHLTSALLRVLCRRCA